MKPNWAQRLAPQSQNLLTGLVKLAYFQSSTCVEVALG